MEQYNKQRHTDFFWHYDLTGQLKRGLKMAEIKGIVLLLNTLGWTAFTYGLFVSFFNVDVFTRTVMSFLGIVFIAIKIVSYAFASNRRHKLENLEIRKLLNEEKEKELKIRREEIEIYKRENDIIKGFNQ